MAIKVLGQWVASDLAELHTAFAQMVELTEPRDSLDALDTVYMDAIALRLEEETLTDGSKVYNVRVALRLS